MSSDKAKKEKDIVAFKTKLYPTKRQKEYLNRCFGIRRFAWNFAVENWSSIKSWQKLDKIWNNSGFLFIDKPYLYEVNSMVKQMAFKDVKLAWDKVWNEGAGKPKFKSKKKDSNRFSMNMKVNTENNKTIKFQGRRINLNATRKLGRLNIKCAENLDFLNQKGIRIAEWTISEKNGNYYISIIYERTNHKYEKEVIADKIGMDGGLKTMFVAFDGSKVINIDVPNKLKAIEKEIDYLNSKLAKKEYGSIRYNLLRKKINRLYEKHRNIKKDFLEKETTYLAKHYNQINLEALKHNLTVNLKHCRRKLQRLNHFEFTERLTTKCKQYETILNIIDGEPTTQTCSCCGHRYVKEEKLSIGDREFKCVKCGFTDDRDANASKNIYKIA